MSTNPDDDDDGLASYREDAEAVEDGDNDASSGDDQDDSDSEK